MTYEYLSDEQLIKLLKDSEQRLRGANVNKQKHLRLAPVKVPKDLGTTSIASHIPTTKLNKVEPKISAAVPVTPSLSDTGEECGGNSRGIKSIKVTSILLPGPKMPSMRMIYHFQHEQPLDPSWAPLCKHDVSTFIVTLRRATKLHAGADWYDLPRTVMTPELRRDFQLLRMRSVLDPKLALCGAHSHYRGNDTKSLFPKFSQIGTIIEGPTEFFTARLSNRERKRTLVAEVLASENISHRFKSKYSEIQAAKTSGRKACYTELKARRRKKWPKS